MLMNQQHIMYKLFSSFEENNINYIHFKSNTNLSKSFEGKADFDVLVDKNRIIDVERLIAEHNGKRHNPIHIGDYPGVDNWLVFDDISGKIYHLHLHYHLATGKPLVKDYIIPWNELLFSTRKKDAEFHIYRTDYNVELFLLAFRSVLKANSFDYVKKIIGSYKLKKGLQLEWDDLKTKTTPAGLRCTADIVCPDQADRFVEILSKNVLTSKDYLWIHRYVRKVMNVHRRYSGFEATLRTVVYQFLVKVRKIWSRKMGGLSIIKKTSLQGGLIIAFVGVDGAGKSTLSNEVAKWMSAGKIDSRRFYMGTGDGKTTFFMSFIKKLHKINNERFSKKKQEDKDHHLNEKGKIKVITWYKDPIKFIKKYIRVLQINSVQKNNTRKIKNMYRYKLNGGISVLDRWPQIEIAGQNDGPKIVKYRDVFGNNRLLERSIEKEKENLDIVRTILPDIIFRLNISLDTCMKRKTEHTNRHTFERKLDELNQLKFQGANIVEINAELPYDEELLMIKKYLWRYI